MTDAPDEALVEAVAQAIFDSWNPSVRWQDIKEENREAFRCDARAAYAAIVDHLGLHEERGRRVFANTITGNPGRPARRRLVSRYQEVSE